MKKFIALFLALLMMSTLVFATESPSLSLAQVTASQGEIVTVPVTVSGNVGLAGFSFDITYNKAYLTPVNVGAGAIWADAITHNIVDGVEPSGVLTVVGATTADITENGVLCNLRFRVSSSASGEFPLTLVNKGICNSNYETIDFNITNGRIVVNNTSGEVISPSPEQQQPTAPVIPETPEKEEAPKEISVYIDGKTVEFDVSPVIIDGRTLVPMRAIFEQLGAYVWWEDEIKTAIGIKDSVMVAIAIDKPYMRKNDKEITLDVSAKLIDARTMVPLRAISEAYGCEVEWIDAKKQINIYTKGE